MDGIVAKRGSVDAAYGLAGDAGNGLEIPVGVQDGQLVVGGGYGHEEV
jgi:hypothetical protein